MSGEPTVIYRAANPQQAYLLKGLLEDRGIPAWVVNDSMQIAGGELPLGWRAAACVSVGAIDAEEARRFAEEFNQTTAHDPSPEATFEPPEPDAWQDWPCCPECRTPRQARCPICGAVGKKFPLAAIEERQGHQRVLLICDACDDHFLPEFFRRCHQCGHDYQTGISVEAPSAPVDDSPRTWYVLALLLAGGALLAGYLYYIVQ
ncbi:MAG: DUF2007 domain-containing protein [Pirellulaceae bacterium]|jgi:hypothetical protein|nr:DUF2007 domain-containing protein [Pirellulaceae bacterium]